VRASPSSVGFLWQGLSVLRCLTRSLFTSSGPVFHRWLSIWAACCCWPTGPRARRDRLGRDALSAANWLATTASYQPPDHPSQGYQAPKLVLWGWGVWWGASGRGRWARAVKAHPTSVTNRYVDPIGNPHRPLAPLQGLGRLLGRSQVGLGWLRPSFFPEAAPPRTWSADFPVAAPDRPACMSCGP